MARTSVTTQKITRAGVAPALTAPTAEGDIVDCGDVAVWVAVDAGSPATTVTIPSPITYDGLQLAPAPVTVPPGSFRIIGSIPARTFAQPGDATDGSAGRALVNYSQVTGVTRGVIGL